LPPNEEKTEILRVVVRESMSLDLLDRLIADICSITESLMNAESEFDLASFGTLGSKSVEKTHASLGPATSEKGKTEAPMSNGVHRAVC
jgi:glutamate decarboxylase